MANKNAPDLEVTLRTLYSSVRKAFNSGFKNVPDYSSGYVSGYATALLSVASLHGIDPDSITMDLELYDALKEA